MKQDSLKKKLKNLKVVIVAHEFNVHGGLADNLKEFFLKNNVSALLFISHPLLDEKEWHKNTSRYYYYKNSTLKQAKTAFHYRLPDVFLYGKDILLTIYWSVTKSRIYDLFIGYDPLNALAGLILQKVGIVKKVIYYSIDYFPQRFENKMINSIYHMIDKLCVRFSDETWNVGSRMELAREKYNNMDRRIYNRQYYTPIGVWYNEIKRKPFEKINKKKILYAGHLAPHMGVELIIRALPEIIKKVPNVDIEVIGMGESEGEIKELAKKLGVYDRIMFFDWIGDRKTFEKHLVDSAIGLAPFLTNSQDDKVKNADPGKIKDYMNAGMIVVTTKTLSTYRDLEKAKVGVIIDYDPNQLSYAVLKLLNNDRLLAEYRANALSYVKQFDWNLLFGKNLKRLFSKTE